MKPGLERVSRFFSAGPAVRVSLGLSALVVSLLLAADLVFGLLPDQDELSRQLRLRAARDLATHAATQLEAGDMRALDKLFRDVLQRDKELVSVAVRRDDGDIVAQAGNHARAWKPPRDDQARVDNLRVPLVMNGQPWGGVEVSFQPAPGGALSQWLHKPSVYLVVLLGIGSFAAFTLYMRRVLSHLDPSAVIPDRVRSAFDVFSSGVMIVDPSARLMLANSTLRLWMGKPDEESLHGRSVETLPWFEGTLPAERKEHLWMRAMASGKVEQGKHMEFRRDGGAPLRMVVNASPILDQSRSVRGCLVTFENVTDLYDLNMQLVQSMSELEESKREIEMKNDELIKLATRDPLTGALNRRALFDKLEPMFAGARQRGRPLCCIMTDIDHFKSFNDRHGHAVGDQVLQSVTRSLSSALREVDMLCRYGGEEFCIILPEVDLEQTRAIAERLRADVEAHAGPSVRSISGLRVTSSFGIAIMGPDTDNPARLIDMADQALYAAKHGGRNCVKAYVAPVAVV